MFFIMFYAGFAWQDSGKWWAIGLASVRRGQKLALCLMEPIPSSFRADPPLAKAEPFSDGGSTSGTTELKTNGRECTRAIATREERSRCV